MGNRTNMLQLCVGKIWKIVTSHVMLTILYLFYLEKLTNPSHSP